MNLEKFYMKRLNLCFAAGLVSEMALLFVAILFLGNALLWFITMGVMIFIGILYAKLLTINANKLKEVKNDLRTMRTSAGND